MSDDAKDTHQPSPAAHPASGLSKAVLLLGILLLLWVGLGQVGPRLVLSYFPGHGAALDATSGENARQIAALRMHIDQLDAQIKALHGRVNTPVKPGVANDAALNAKIDALQSRIDALQKMHAAGAASDAALQAITARLNAMETRNNHQLAALAVFEPMKEAVVRGAAFGAQLSQLSQLTQGDDKVQALLKQLSPYADSGAVTTTQLHSDFEALIPRALSPDAGGNSLMHNLESLVRIRRVGEQQKGNDDESVIARSEARLYRGDVAASAKTLAALSPQAAETFAPWLEKVREWQRIRDTLDALQLALLATEPPPPAAAPVTPLPPAAGEVAPEPSGVHSL